MWPRPAVILLLLTVNSQIFARIIFSLVCCVVLGILSSLSYILLMKRELAALFYSCCVYLSYVSLPRSAPRGYSDNFIHT